MNRLFSVTLNVGDGKIEYLITLKAFDDNEGFDKVEALLSAMSVPNTEIKISTCNNGRILKGG